MIPRSFRVLKISSIIKYAVRTDSDADWLSCFLATLEASIR